MSTCQADVMDRERFVSWKDVVPACDEPATVEVESYLLCEGCAEALETLERLC